MAKRTITIGCHGTDEKAHQNGSPVCMIQYPHLVMSRHGVRWPGERWAGRAVEAFLLSGGLVFGVTAAAKVLSSMGHVALLDAIDPVFGVRYRILFAGVGAVEACVAVACVVWRNVVGRLGVIAWMTSNIVVYRIGLWWMEYKGHCRCLGTYTDNIGVSEQHAEAALVSAVWYCGIGVVLSAILIRSKRKSDSEHKA